MLPWSAELAGRIDEQVITSELLRANPLGDPCERPVWVYLPLAVLAIVGSSEHPADARRAINTPSGDGPGRIVSARQPAGSAGITPA